MYHTCISWPRRIRVVQGRRVWHGVRSGTAATTAWLRSRDECRLVLARLLRRGFGVVWILAATLFVGWLPISPGSVLAVPAPVIAIAPLESATESQVDATPTAQLEAARSNENDLTCSDFAGQAEAQTAFDADPSDPHGL